MNRTLAAVAASSARDKRNVVLFGALIVLIFSVADVRTPGAFPWSLFGVRLLWAAMTAAVGLALPGGPRVSESTLLAVLAIETALFRCLLAALSGGAHSQAFSWIVITPVLIAIVVQEHPWATVLSGATTLVGGLWMLAAAGAELRTAAQWTVQIVGTSSLAFYASYSYRRLHLRQADAQKAQLLAVERQRQLESEQTARLAAEDALRRRDEFLSSASHELRTPLTTLRLQVDNLAALLQRGPISVEALQDKLAVLDRQTRNLGELTERLLDVSRIAARRLTLEPAPMDIAELARDLHGRLAVDAERAGCPFELSINGPVPGTWDRVRVGQVLTNLITNAFKYGAQKPVRVHVGREGDQAIVEVIDHGIGIAPEDFERIFERFERAASVRHYGGLGIGLWVCRQLLEAMGGSISVRSSAEGSVFRVHLPTVRSSSAPLALH